MRTDALFQPVKLNEAVTLKNRIIKTAQWFVYPEPDGSVGDRMVAFYSKLAEGKPGQITVEESICDYPLGASNMPHPRLDEDRFIPGLKRLADAIHEHDVPAIVQITHAGPAHNPEQPNGGQPIGPSSIDPPSEPTQAVARELTVAEIEDLIEKWAQAARRCHEAGFDGAEIHVAHYALGGAFLSRRQNKRTDEYGCDTIENRTRFTTSIMKRVRELCGPDFVIGARMNGKEWGDPLGTTSEEAVEIAQALEAAGAQYLQVSAYGYGAYWMAAFPDYVNMLAPPEVGEFTKRIPEGALIPETAAIKRAVSIPVSGVGRLSFEAANDAITDGSIDMAAFGRHFMADPEFPIKLAEGRPDDIRPCNGCLHCLHVLFTNQPVECRVNPYMGHELDLQITPTEQPRKVMVVGSGPAGLEAARVAAIRGHDVSLWEKKRSLGGLLPMVGFIKGTDKDDAPSLVEWYERQLKSLDVKIHMHSDVTAETVAKEAPDVAVLAMGGKALPAPIENGGKVMTTDSLRSRAKGFVQVLGPDAMSKITKAFLPTGKNVVVVGSDLAGLETVEFLVERGKNVTLVDEAPQIGKDVDIHMIVKYPLWLEAVGVPLYTGVKYGDVTKKGLMIETADGEELELEADTIMVVTHYGRNADLYDELANVVGERHLIGDAQHEGGPGYIHGAIRDGALVGTSI